MCTLTCPLCVRLRLTCDLEKRIVGSCVFDTRRVNDRQGSRFDLRFDRNDITRRAGGVGDNRDVVTSQVINELTLAGVRFTSHRDNDPGTTTRSLAKSLSRFIQLLGQLPETFDQQLIAHEFNVFVDKIQPRFDVGQQVEHR